MPRLSVSERWYAAGCGFGVLAIVAGESSVAVAVLFAGFVAGCIWMESVS